MTRRQDEDMAVLTGRKLDIFLCVKMYILKVLQSYSKYYLPDVSFQKLHHVVPNRKKTDVITSTGMFSAALCSSRGRRGAMLLTRQLTAS